MLCWARMRSNFSGSAARDRDLGLGWCDDYAIAQF